MGTFGNDTSIEGDVYVQRLATYIRRNEEALANGLLCFSKSRSSSTAKPLRLSFTIHHLYYITERIENSSLGVDVGPLNVKLDTPNHEPTFISFMATNARSLRQFESDARSITSINSMKSIVSSASVYWRSFAFSRDPKVIHKDVKYLYLSFTKIPCLILTPKTKISSISGYEEYPCDTSVPLKMFKNLQVLELVEYEPNEVFGWHALSEQLRILIIRNSKISDIAEILYTLVLDDENGRSSFSNPRQSKKHDQFDLSESPVYPAFKNSRRERAFTSVTGSANPRELFLADHKWQHVPNLPSSPTHARGHSASLPESKWFYLKQLTVSESSITSIPAFVFKPLANLVKLNLSNNLLEDLPEGLDQLHNVKYMNFADNYITNLNKLPLNLEHLTTLNFNNNKLTSLEGLENLACIEKIDLRRNKLKEIKLLRPLVLQFMKSKSRLNNIFISSNPLPKTYRADLFNLFNGVKAKNTVKIDDSRPGYFENAMLLDAEGAFKLLEKFLDLEKPEPPAELPARSPISSTPERPSQHRHTKSTGDMLEVAQSLALLNLQDLENTIVNRKHTSIMTTASTTTLSAANSVAATELSNISPSPSMILPKTPLNLNQNLSNQAQFCNNKMPSIARQSFSSPMMHLSVNGSSTTLKSSGTTARLDLGPTSTHNPAPSVITPVQVQVEGFQ